MGLSFKMHAMTSEDKFGLHDSCIYFRIVFTKSSGLYVIYNFSLYSHLWLQNHFAIQNDDIQMIVGRVSFLGQTMRRQIDSLALCWPWMTPVNRAIEINAQRTKQMLWGKAEVTSLATVKTEKPVASIKGLIFCHFVQR